MGRFIGARKFAGPQSRILSLVGKLGPAFNRLQQEQTSHLALGVQEDEMLIVDLRTRGNHQLNADPGRFELD